LHAGRVSSAWRSLPQSNRDTTSARTLVERKFII
jgi:hypothetical protein